jgi:DNA-binding NtrC family response regulator
LERQALEELNCTITFVSDTKEAMTLLASHPTQFATVISDFYRRNDPEAGYPFLKRVSHLHDAPPIVIYSASSTPLLAEKAMKAGAYGETNQPKELLSLVIHAAMGRNVAVKRRIGRNTSSRN